MQAIGGVVAVCILMAGKSAWSDTNGATSKIDENELVVDVGNITVNKKVKIAAQSKFVEPLTLYVFQYRSDCTIYVGFNFLGEKTEDRNINVKLVMLDSSGKEVFATEWKSCKDARLEKDIIHAGRLARASHTNSARFQMSPDVLAKTKGVRIIFQNVVTE